MKTSNPKRPRDKAGCIPHSRWLAYATASAATALAGVGSAEADITYSGPISEYFNAPTPGLSNAAIGTFPLAQPGNYLGFEHFRNPAPADPTHGNALFVVYGLASQAFAGDTMTLGGHVYGEASELTLGQNISTRPFVTINRVSGYADPAGYLAGGSAYGHWRNGGTGFLGFKFDNGGGVQYGWARVTMDPTPGDSFTVVDYAYGGVGDQIFAGQVPEPGSLGLLAMGGAGLLVWRKRRAQLAKATVV